MIPDKLPAYVNREVERLAANFLRNAFGTRLTIPIDVEMLLEGTPGVILDVIPHLRDNHQVEGCDVRDATVPGLMVIIDGGIADRYRLHYRMVVAEELGHVKLHGGVMVEIESADDFLKLQRRPDWRRVEHDAKAFGRAVLMPLPLLKRVAEELYPALVEAAGFGDTGAIQKYFRNVLAERFEVRPEDMHRRLSRWPCDLYERVIRSVRLRRDYLIEVDAVSRASRNPAQLEFWDEFVESEPSGSDD